MLLEVHFLKQMSLLIVPEKKNDAVRSAFLGTSEFIDSALKKECEKDDCRWGNFFASKLTKKISKI